MELDENADYLGRQLITYLGNKRGLLGVIEAGVETARQRIGGRKLASFDVFSGSGVVSRFLRKHSRRVVVNDLEPYAAIINKCYMAYPSQSQRDEIAHYHGRLIAELTEKPLRCGLVASMYAPHDDNNIQPGERAFFTRRNAMYIDTARQLIDEVVPIELQHFFIAPLLYCASVHTNTSGVFKGFYKNEHGVGQFGGKGKNALSRIMADIALPQPLFSDFDVPVTILTGNANDIAEEVSDIDLSYLDPPYNQHPYGSNYFMLNVIHEYKVPRNVSAVSGIPAGWKRSDYNKRACALSALEDLIRKLRSRFVLVSYSSEGHISQQDMTRMLESFGSLAMFEVTTNAFRGSRNLHDRAMHVQELLFLLDKDTYSRIIP